MYYHPLGLLAGLTIFSIFCTADALRCYKCASYEMEMCADYFNQTEIRRRLIYIHNPADPQMPKEVDCGNEFFPYPSINQRAVCMKKVETDFGRKKYTRQCMFVNRELTTLECPRDPPNSHRTLESCDVCDTDLCNKAPLHSMTGILTFVPILTTLYLKS